MDLQAQISGRRSFALKVWAVLSESLTFQRNKEMHPPAAASLLNPIPLLSSICLTLHWCRLHTYMFFTPYSSYTWSTSIYRPIPSPIAPSH